MLGGKYGFFVLFYAQLVWNCLDVFHLLFVHTYTLCSTINHLFPTSHVSQSGIPPYKLQLILGFAPPISRSCNSFCSVFG